MKIARRQFLGQSLGMAVALGAGTSALLQPPRANAGLADRSAADLSNLTIDEASVLLRNRAISPVELVDAYVARIAQFDKPLNCFITLTEELAYEQARSCERELLRGKWRGPLHGIPIALKDNIDTAGIRTTAGSAIYADRVPDMDAEVARRLQAAGAILLGKVNMHEFAYGDTTGISHFGPTHNPWNSDHAPGGSSGGAAAAVAARLCAAALGTDTGGSIRQPSAFCGVVGFKPTYGLISIRGIVPLAETQDHVGPICRSVADAAHLLQVLAGYDRGDLWSIRADTPDYRKALEDDVSGLRLGIPRKFFYESLDIEVESLIEDALQVLQMMTASNREVEVPLTTLRVVAAEAYAWHHDLLVDEKTRQLYQPRVRDRLLRGSEVPAHTYIEARRQQLQSRRDVEKVFEEVDLLVTPTSPDLPVTIEEGQNPSNPLAFSLRNTAPFNANGIPTISIPCGFSKSGLPVGLQISGPRLGESAVLTLAHAYERVTDWHLRTPSLG